MVSFPRNSGSNFMDVINLFPSFLVAGEKVLSWFQRIRVPQWLQMFMDEVFRPRVRSLLGDEEAPVEFGGEELQRVGYKK
jgi:hypothetical protein